MRLFNDALQDLQVLQIMRMWSGLFLRWNDKMHYAWYNDANFNIGSIYNTPARFR